DLAQQLPPVEWSQALRHLPEMDIIRAVDGPKGIFADSMPGIATGGAMIKRAPNDSAWYRGGLFHDDMRINVPGLWFMSWYDVSVGPNLATYNHVRNTADPVVAKQQYAIIAPTLHCAYKRATENTVVGGPDAAGAVGWRQRMRSGACAVRRWAGPGPGRAASRRAGGHGGAAEGRARGQGSGGALGVRLIRPQGRGQRGEAPRRLPGR